MPALYDVAHAYKDLHQTVLKLAEGLSEEQLRWKPENYSTSLGFHLWHLAREADYLKAATLHYFPQIGPDFGEPHQIWETERLAEKWGFPANLGETGVGTGIPDEIAASLPLPPKAELLDYLQRAYAQIDRFVEQLDERYASLEGVEPSLQTAVGRIRLNLLVFLLHDGRHLGMMECLKGLLTGFGSATETRKT